MHNLYTRSVLYYKWIGPSKVLFEELLIENNCNKYHEVKLNYVFLTFHRNRPHSFVWKANQIYKVALLISWNIVHETCLSLEKPYRGLIFYNRIYVSLCQSGVPRCFNIITSWQHVFLIRTHCSILIFLFYTVCYFLTTIYKIMKLLINSTI